MDHKKGDEGASSRWRDSWRYRILFFAFALFLFPVFVRDREGFIADDEISDFEKTFIQAIVYNYEVLKEYGTENEVRAAGKVMTKGKDYEMVGLALNSPPRSCRAERLDRWMEISSLSKPGPRNREVACQ